MEFFRAFNIKADRKNIPDIIVSSNTTTSISSPINVPTIETSYVSAFKTIPSIQKSSIATISMNSISKPRVVALLKDNQVPSYRKLAYTDVQPNNKNGVFPCSAASMNTLKLLQTYRIINQKFYSQPPVEVKKTQISINDTLNNRYRIIKKLGSGAFGVVFEAFDSQLNCNVAVKVLTSATNANEEMNIVSALNQHDVLQKFVIKLIDSFKYNEFSILVFELMSLSLYDIIRNTSYLGCSLHLVRKFGRQLLQTLEFLRNPTKCAESNGVIHCDLKPENILLCNKKNAQIKLIDFGSACVENVSKLHSYIQSRFYRSPEVILGLPYSYPIDMWSLGCVLVELHTGHPLFDGQTEAEQIMKMVSVLGAPPSTMIEESDRGLNYFKKMRDGFALLPSKTLGVTAPISCNPLHLILGINTGGPGGRRVNEKSGHARSDYHALYDLISRMLDYNPLTRITPSEALRHPFFAELAATTENNTPTPAVVSTPTPVAHVIPVSTPVPIVPIAVSNDMDVETKVEQSRSPIAERINTSDVNGNTGTTYNPKIGRPYPNQRSTKAQMSKQCRLSPHVSNKLIQRRNARK